MKETISSKNKARLYALLVGISEYMSEIRLVNETVRFPKLAGCVNDALKVKNYLEKENYYDPQIEVLFNENASKSEIVRMFQEHLCRAEENDVVLFYYSGHGTQEHTDKAIFASETDGKLESIVCYYDEQTKENFLLADKELRWLINKAASKNPHIVAIFDCCHSSGITRNAELVDAIFPNVKVKRIPFVFPKRQWNNYIFSDPEISNHISAEEIMSKGEYFMLPEASHIQLSACESNESAVEVSGEGVFTKALLKVLNSADGQVSYQMLNNRVRQYLRNIYEQKPMLYIAKSDQSILFSTFLNKSSKASNGALGEVAYNLKAGWQINLGAIHGINNSINQIIFFDPSKTDRIYISRLGVVSTDFSQLLINDAELLDKEKVYKANLTGLMSNILPVFISAGNALPEDQFELLNEITENSKEFIELVDDEQVAQYSLIYTNGNYFITHSNDPYRPLTELVKAGGENWTKTITELFKHISAWTFIKNLTNSDKNTQLADNAISIKIATGIPLGSLLHVIEDSNVIIKYAVYDKRLVSKIKIELSNTGGTDLYCCPVYLTSNFQSFTGYLNPEVYHLEPSEVVVLNLEGTEELDIVSSEMIKWYNWQKHVDCLKFIVSTEHFDATGLQLDPLLEAPAPNERLDGSATERGIITALSKNAIKGWRTYDVKIEFLNPNFNSISHYELDAMLKDENTNYFAVGLYYNASVNENLQAVYSLKPDIKMVEEPGIIAERGIIRDTAIDIANWYSRKKRNQHYQNVVTRFPGRLKFVSEGDSWFQHPLVLDIIDHLSKIYAIYCVSAAGDTLSNYLSDDKKRGEYFLNAIDQQKPQYFLISGGGNDILGSQFRDFLIDDLTNISKESAPDKFLKKSFFEKLKELMGIYKSVFGHLEVIKPDLQIIAHGYDYPVKLNDKKHGWLGRYMMEKGISKTEDGRI